MLGRVRPEDCERLCRHRIELEHTLEVSSIDLEKCVRICKSALI
jgi:hypothetical protein